MTSSQIPSRKAFLKPFASDGLITDFPDTDGEAVNISTGFPSPYSAPGGSGGRYVGRGDINAIGNLATNDLFYHKCGGLNTFDAAFAEKVGGYPKGAVLDYINGTNVFKVISLIDDNAVDFVSVGVDGVNWAYCNMQEAVRDRLEMLSLNNVPVGYNLESQSAVASPIGAFYATKSGAIIVNMESTVESSVDRSSGYFPAALQYSLICGVGIAVKEFNSDSDYTVSTPLPTVSDLNNLSKGWFLVSADTFGTGLNIGWNACTVSGRITSLFAMRAVQGKYYVVVAFAGSASGGATTTSGGGSVDYIEGTLTTTVNSLKVFID